MLGAEQEAWIADRFATSTTIWNCLAQQTVLSDTRIGEVGAILNYDQWDGYHPARERLLAGAPPNFVTLTGDIHLAGVAEIGPIGDPLGIEFITTAISSTANVDPALAEVVLSIPSIVDGELVSRGYTRHTVTAGCVDGRVPPGRRHRRRRRPTSRPGRRSVSTPAPPPSPRSAPSRHPQIARVG